MKLTTKLGLVLVFCLSQLLIQCSADEKTNGVQVPVEQDTEEIIKLKSFISKSIPIELGRIVYYPKSEMFVISGDIIMTLEEARENFIKFELKNTGKTKQVYSTIYRVLPEYTSAIKVFISPEVEIGWRAAAKEAINVWNTTNTSITLYLVETSVDSDVQIKAPEIVDECLAKAKAQASLPTGYARASVLINKNYNFLSNQSKLTTMVHELGHTRGLLHTNEYKENTNERIAPCTPLIDRFSVMNGSSPSNWTKLNFYDVLATSTLYPIGAIKHYPHDQNTKKLYRYKKNQFYFYTTDPCEVIADRDGYVFDNDGGYVYSTQMPGTEPLYRLLNGAAFPDHKLSRIQKDANDVILGYIYPTQHSGTTPLYSNIASYDYFPTVNHYLYTTVSNPDVIKKIIVGYVLTK
ncbi:M57 family metalloprotease [Flavobacterium sp. LAR06]|uniref:M57 family metalloprotease n=1 Tax=Flavobacterium sp. LAR06 TaxID=3064897 RepID=UPI0035C0A357